ncbi:MAG: hypothetical protein JW937_01790 [Candidatus Omnitrophica bacterium]|nr:hypothetical protein [Candidatus Omnitrophota bacterium]
MNMLEYDPTPVITLDLDWAPDFCIDYCAQVLIDQQVKATWFLTHLSPAVERLRNHPKLFELGWHPNFMPGSTHGSTMNEVFDHMKTLVPEARCMRTHNLVQSTSMMRMASVEYGVETDVSLCLLGTNFLMPHRIHYLKGHPGILRIPYYWEDDLIAMTDTPDWQARSFHTPGLRIYDFHPIHVWLNMSDLSQHRQMKDRYPMGCQSPEQSTPFINPGEGTGTFFKALVDIASQSRSSTISEISDRYVAAESPAGGVS